jgi:hypothetical protein
MIYRPIIFPELVDATWVKVDLGARARKDFPDTSKPNPLLNGVFCNDWVSRIAREKDAEYTWGGYLEDRKHLWRGYYEDAECVTHLGVDYNVPAGTVVSVPRDCVVVHKWTDHELENGWGGRLIVRFSESWQGAPFLILGHLAYEGLPEIGAHFSTGQPIARTGIIAENGGWFPHLHVQCCSTDFFNRHASDLENLDGYYLERGYPLDIAPDPSKLVGTEITSLPELLMKPGSKPSVQAPKWK